MNLWSIINLQQREKNQGFQDKCHKRPMHKSLHMTKAPLLDHENNNARVTKVEEALAVECREKEERNNKVVISYTYHTLNF